MATNSDVQRFMILGAARTGSNFLLSLLSAHPYIQTYGELFNLDSLPKESLLEALADPITYLRRRVYRVHGPEIAAVGFKMFYYHLTKYYFQKAIDVSETSPQLQEKFLQLSSFIESNYEWDTLYGRFQATWEFLRSDGSLAVIHLKRRNALHALMSLKTAFLTNRWLSLGSRSQAAPAVHLDPDECCRYFDMLETYASEADAAFRDHPKIEVIYEDLVGKQRNTLQRIFAFLRVPYQPVTARMRKQIFAFLRVPYQPVTARMRKQNRVSPSEALGNYNQLKNYFRHSRWSAFFE